MSSLARAARRSSAFVALLLAAAGCASVRSRTDSSVPPSQRLSEQERIAHVLSRLTFGARPGDAERLAAKGIDRWIDEQLRPESIADSTVLVALAPIPQWSQPVADVTAVLGVAPTRLATTPMAMLAKDSAAFAALRQLAAKLALVGATNDLFYAGKIVRAQFSERQLLEVVTDFWENHFSVYAAKMPSREAIITWDREVLRPRALGKFRDLLGAVAHSPAMLFYLDNQLSTRRGLNENYARELLELHTLGVDGGYTQQDVIEVARALTGWTLTQSRNPTGFLFRPEQHDTGTKIVLGHTLRSGRGIQDGEEVLDILARHPSTARYISFKLARRLVSDDPPPALVARAAATFTRTDGDIAEVVRTIVTSKEFYTRAAFRAKVKTPFELVVSVRRALDAPADTTAVTARQIGTLGQPIFGWAAPDGWPEKGGPWMNSGTIYKRIQFGNTVANATGASVPVYRWREFAALAAVPLEQQVDGVANALLGGYPEPNTREVMLGIRNGVAETSGDGVRRLRELLAVAMAAPEFQRR